MNLRHLDILRALLALMVLGGHARMMLWMPWQEWKLLPHGWIEYGVGAASGLFRFGHEAVVVFFALSGFFIHLRMAMQMRLEAAKTFDTAGYLRRRAWRILPPYFAVLLFTVMLDSVGRTYYPLLYSAQTGDALLDSNFRAAGYSPESVIPALLAQPNLFGIRFGGNAPLWSIGSEVFYYLLYPLFIGVWLRSRWAAYALGTSLAAACHFAPVLGPWSGAALYYPIWLAGALLAEVLVMYPEQSRKPWWLASSGFISVATLAIAQWKPVHDFMPLLLPCYMLLGVSTVAFWECLPSALLKDRTGSALEWLGIRSYSLYIFHFPVLVLISAWVFQTQGARPSSGWLALGGALLSLLFGLIGFRLVEERFLPSRISISGKANLEVSPS
jgi:peptidoglycan/LPS O-acetylase OafA/YrhL